MRTLIAIIKLFSFAVFTLIAVSTQLLVLAFCKGPKAYIIPMIWHKGLCFIFGIKIKHIGHPIENEQTIFVSNHLSYLDIIVLGTTLRASFVAKSDVASWPVFGFLSRLQQTAFISRSREDAKKGKSILDDMLADGKSLIIFPEGTSTDGRDVVPFKSSLFSIAYKKDLENIKIQPITLVMHKVDDHKIETQDDRDLYAWHINMTTPLGEHLWRFSKTTGAEIHLHYHTPVLAKDFSNRKMLAKACHEAVSNGLEK